MKLKTLLVAVIATLLITTVVLSGCNQSKQGSQAVNEVVITDSTGRNIAVPQPINRVVVLNSDAAEAMRILKTQDTIIGVGDTVQKTPYLKMQDKIVVGKWNAPSYEKIMELRPQVIITYSKTPGEELTQKLEPAGIKVVRLDLFKPETYDSDLKSLARMFGKGQEADSFLQWKAEKTAVLASKLKGLPSEQKVKVFAMWANNLGKWKTFAQGTSVHQGIVMAGGINVAGELKDYPEISSEWILQQNPSHIVIGTYDDQELGYAVADYTSVEKLSKKASENEILSKTEAGKKGNIYIIQTKLLGGDKTYMGAFFLARWFYPQRFKDVNPEQVLKEYFERWVGVPFQGKWVYPGM